MSDEKRAIYQKCGPQVTVLKTEDQSLPMPPPLQFHPQEPENQVPVGLKSGQKKRISPKKKNLPFSSN